MPMAPGGVNLLPAFFAPAGAARLGRRGGGAYAVPSEAQGLTLSRAALPKETQSERDVSIETTPGTDAGTDSPEEARRYRPEAFEPRWVCSRIRALLPLRDRR